MVLSNMTEYGLVRPDWSGLTNGLTKNEKGGGPGLPASFFPLSGNPASLTEGD